MIRRLHALDLHAACGRIQQKNIEERLAVLSAALPDCALVAIGGIPFLEPVTYSGPLTWAGSRATAGSIKKQLLQGLGLSAVLTYSNPNAKSLEELGEMCDSRQETWAYHWMTVSILFNNVSRDAELAFLRDTRFFTSWPALLFPDNPIRLFVVHGSLKNWKKWIERRDDVSFGDAARGTMRAAKRVLDPVLP